MMTIVLQTMSSIYAEISGLFSIGSGERTPMAKHNQPSKSSGTIQNPTRGTRTLWIRREWCRLSPTLNSNEQVISKRDVLFPDE